MNTQEVFSDEATRHLANIREQAKYLENAVQIAWFEYRSKALKKEEVELRLERLKQDSPEQRGRIEHASSDERLEIIMEDMVLSPGSAAGGEERQWFRESFITLPKAKELLSRFETEPDAVLLEIDRLFTASRH